MKKMIFGIVSTIVMSSVAYADITGAGATLDRKSTRLNSSHVSESRMPSSA